MLCPVARGCQCSTTCTRCVRPSNALTVCLGTLKSSVDPLSSCVHATTWGGVARRGKTLRGRWQAADRAEVRLQTLLLHERGAELCQQLRDAADTTPVPCKHSRLEMFWVRSLARPRLVREQVNDSGPAVAQLVGCLPKLWVGRGRA